MADVKWIKLKVGMFDGMSFKKIKKAKIGGESYRDKLTAVWFELMDFAAQCNHDGAFIDSREIPFYELSDIAIMIDRETDELELCMAFFINEGMVSIEDDIYMLSAWSAYQNTDRLAELREYNRLAKQKQRAKQKLLQDVKDKSMTSQSCQDTDIDKEEDKEREEEYINNIVPSPSSSKSKKPVKHKYGEFQNVLLTDAEYKKLSNEYGEMLLDEAVTFLDEYIGEKGYKSKSHNLAIRRWVIEAVQDRKKKPATVNQPKQQNSTNDFMSQLQQMYNEEC